MTSRPSIDALEEGVRNRDRKLLSQAITLVESARAEDIEQGEELLRRLRSTTNESFRIGISGAPGVGKSSFINTLGEQLIRDGKTVAVLAVDPSSTITGGSILGDKTRMESLARNDAAFIRPSPGGTSAGGVAHRTREVILLCEASGHDVILVETIGVGQSETAVANMVDSFLLLLLAGAGDELQGIKRGVMELANVIAIHKADGANEEAVGYAQAEFSQAITLLHSQADSWQPPVLACSSLTGTGIDNVWDALEEHRSFLGTEGVAAQRQQQSLHWFDDALTACLLDRLLADPETHDRLSQLRQEVCDGTLQPTTAARKLLD
ncbi:MAG: methylmalonyl Co-A mutase-associated GTPase MeaB [Planctomycetota bacterium]|jgi:LAO/AO transport system kinase|nr:methylmalonyl Co-A mutase-associated GTPase MeaB [Planctomycetota bacterium]